jgi:hypothetical protein
MHSPSSTAPCMHIAPKRPGPLTYLPTHRRAHWRTELRIKIKPQYYFADSPTVQSQFLRSILPNMRTFILYPLCFSEIPHMPAKNGFELHDSDIELLHFVCRLRLAQSIIFQHSPADLSERYG